MPKPNLKALNQDKVYDKNKACTPSIPTLGESADFILNPTTRVVFY